MWVPKFAEFEALYRKWIEEWNKVYGYRPMTCLAAVLASAHLRFSHGGAAQAQFGPPELIEAARKEGKLVFYRPMSPKAKRR